MNAYLPHSVRLPLGYVVTVKVVSSRHLKRQADGHSVNGLWDVDSRTIYIDRNLPKDLQVYTFTHEMLHAVTDYQHFLLQKVQAKD